MTAAPKEIPSQLIDQLAENGCLVIPVGRTPAIQDLILMNKTKDGIQEKKLEAVSFVPLIQGKI